GIVTSCALTRVDVQGADSLDISAVEVQHRDKPEFPIRRTEHGITAQPYQFDQQVLVEGGLFAVAKDVQVAAVRAGLRANRRGNVTPFIYGVGDAGYREEPFAVYGFVTFQDIALVRIEKVVVVAGQAVDNAPAIRYRLQWLVLVQRRPWRAIVVAGTGLHRPAFLAGYASIGTRRGIEAVRHQRRAECEASDGGGQAVHYLPPHGCCSSLLRTGACGHCT